MRAWILAVSMLAAAGGVSAQALPAAAPEAPPPQRWGLVGQTSDMGVFADTETVERHGDVVIVWERWTAKDPKKPIKLQDGQSYTVAMHRRAYDCIRPKVTTSNSVFYSGDMTKVVKSYDFDTVSTIVPDSVAEDVQRQVCAGTEGMRTP